MMLYSSLRERWSSVGDVILDDCGCTEFCSFWRPFGVGKPDGLKRHFVMCRFSVKIPKERCLF